MNRREFLVTAAGVAAAASTAGLVHESKASTDSQPTNVQELKASAAAQPADKDAAADRMKLVAYCGLYCGLCDSHVRLPQRAAALKESLAMAESPVPKPVRAFLQTMAHPPEGKRCRGGTCGAKCAIKKCAIAKGVTVCADCSEFPCQRIQTLARSESTLIHDGELLRKIGIDAWIEEQEQRKARGFCYADVRCLPCTVPEE